MAQMVHIMLHIFYLNKSNQTDLLYLRKNSLLSTCYQRCCWSWVSGPLFIQASRSQVFSESASHERGADSLHCVYFPDGFFHLESYTNFTQMPCQGLKHFTQTSVGRKAALLPGTPVPARAQLIRLSTNCLRMFVLGFIAATAPWQPEVNHPIHCIGCFENI